MTLQEFLEVYRTGKMFEFFETTYYFKEGVLFSSHDDNESSHSIDFVFKNLGS